MSAAERLCDTMPDSVLRVCADDADDDDREENDENDEELEEEEEECS